MNTKEKKYLISDYVRTHYMVPRTELSFDIREGYTNVAAKYWVTVTDKNNIVDLVLNGDDSIELQNITCNGALIPYHMDGSDLIIDKKDILEKLNDSLVIEIQCKIYPEKNTQLQGMYKSSGTYCTQCEAHGFRRIIYSFDRPDVLSSYTVIISTKKTNPVILSNGNLKSYYEDETRCCVTWEDPHPKPSYLFALVVGDLGYIESNYYIKDCKRNVLIRIYASHDKLNQLDHAMKSIKKAMKWDEERYGLNYDLNIFNIVCMDDFNMGAMENKSLNIFNSEYILATPQTATDQEYELISDVVAHEYFHNWTGNRVTLNKWFDLTLKEGLTVFRDEEFSMDTSVSRIQFLINITIELRNRQFIEDSGPNAHPIRPQEYIVMDNFYTSTVYDKGAQIIRIYQTLLGYDGFRKGMDLYFKRHDGQAVACEDFWKAMYDANIDIDKKLTEPMLRLFNWYHQPGTPMLRIDYMYDPLKLELKINTKQTNQVCTNINKKYDPVLIPIRMGLLDKKGNSMYPTNVTFQTRTGNFTLFCYELEQEFILQGIESEPIPSFMRDFSAPCITDYPMCMNDRLFLMKHDTNLFNRWQQSQLISKSVMCSLYAKSKSPLDYLAYEIAKDQAKNNGLINSDDDISLDEFINLMVGILLDNELEPFIKSFLLNLPLQDEMISLIPGCDPIHLYENVTNKIYKMIALRVSSQSTESNNGSTDTFYSEYLETKSKDLMQKLLSVKYDITYEQVSAREELKTLMRIRTSNCDEKCIQYVEKIYEFYKNAHNLTDRLNCINALSLSEDLIQGNKIYDILTIMLDDMAQQYQGDSLMIGKWLKCVSKVCSTNTVERLTDIFTGKHPKSFMVSHQTPNHMSGLVSSFSLNPYMHQIITDNNQIHAPGYKYITDCILSIDSYNSVTASRIASKFNNVKDLTEGHKICAKICTDRILRENDLSANTREILTK